MVDLTSARCFQFVITIATISCDVNQLLVIICLSGHLRQIQYL